MASSALRACTASGRSSRPAPAYSSSRGAQHRPHADRPSSSRTNRSWRRCESRIRSPYERNFMKRFMLPGFAAIASVAILGVGVLSATAGSAATPMAGTHSHSSHITQAKAVTASDLRALLGKQLGEHAALAMNTTNLGITASPAFAASAKALDQNSVALSKSIASVYGAKA